MRQFLIPAIDRIGREAVKEAMRQHGYVNTDRALDSWVQRRKVPDSAKVMMIKLATKRGVQLELDDFIVDQVDKHMSLSDAATA